MLMASSSFIIEIPERPRYIPGSGPPLAPITLAPDHTETGWILVDLVIVGGVPRYIVTPQDDPVLRKAVKPDRILDWVSPKSFEDFEYDRYKKDIQLQEERKAKRLARAAVLKEKNARRFAEASAGAHFPTGQLSRLPSRANGHYSSTGPESEDISRANSETRTTPMKRKVLNYEGSVKTKRQAVEGIASKPVRQLGGRGEDWTSQDEKCVRNDKVSALAATHTGKPVTSYKPILPPTKLMSPFSSTVKATRANMDENSFSKAAHPQLHANGLPRSFTQGPTKAYPPILPPPKNMMKHFSKHVSESTSKAYAGSSILPPSSVTRARVPIISNESHDKGFWVPSSLARSKGVKVDLFIPATSRSPVRSPSTKTADPKPAPHSKHNITHESQRSLVPEDQIDEVSEEDETDEEETEMWEINGILRTSYRPHPTSGKRVKHYLIDWVGDYEASWEPGECVSEDAIRSFEIEQELKKRKVQKQELNMELKMRENIWENVRDDQTRGNRFGGSVEHSNLYNRVGGKAGDIPHERNKFRGYDQEGFGGQNGASLHKWSKINAKRNSIAKEPDDFAKSFETTIADTEALEEVEAQAQILAEISQLRASGSVTSTEDLVASEEGTSPIAQSPARASNRDSFIIARKSECRRHERGQELSDRSFLEGKDDDDDVGKENDEMSFRETLRTN